MRVLVWDPHTGSLAALYNLTPCTGIVRLVVEFNFIIFMVYSAKLLEIQFRDFQSGRMPVEIDVQTTKEMDFQIQKTYKSHFTKQTFAG